MKPKALSREIKFRAWGTEYGGGETKMRYSDESPDVPCFWTLYVGNKQEYAEAIMQYTGLHDKNGKEIFEGDIMKVLDRDWVDAERDTNIYIVYWYKGGFMLVNKIGIEEKEKPEPNIYNKDWLETTIYKGYGRDKYEIIGNIYENPELLTK